MMKLLKIFAILAFSFFALILFVGLILTYFQLSPVTGRSMEPTLYDGDWIFSSSVATPHIGKVITFRCFADKCKKGEEPVKRLKDISSDGCFFVEGDNQAVSFDSNDYGWLCGDEFSYKATVISIIHR